MAGWSAWHSVVEVGLLAWVVALTLRVRVLSRRLAGHVCREPTFPAPAGTTDPDRHTEVDRPIGVYELINRVEQSRHQEATRPATASQSDPEQTARIRGAPLRPVQTAGRGGNTHPSLRPALHPRPVQNTYRVEFSGDQ